MALSDARLMTLLIWLTQVSGHHKVPVILGETSQGEAREFQDGVAHLVSFLDQDNGGLFNCCWLRFVRGWLA